MALHVLGRPGEQQLTEAETGYEHPGLADLPALDLDPLDRIAGVVDLHAFARCELARGDGRVISGSLALISSIHTKARFIRAT